MYLQTFETVRSITNGIDDRMWYCSDDAPEDTTGAFRLYGTQGEIPQGKRGHRSASSASDVETSTRRNGGKGIHTAPVTPEGNTSEAAERHGSKARRHLRRIRRSDVRRRTDAACPIYIERRRISSQLRLRSPWHRWKGRSQGELATTTLRIQDRTLPADNGKITRLSLPLVLD